MKHSWHTEGRVPQINLNLQTVNVNNSDICDNLWPKYVKSKLVFARRRAGLLYSRAGMKLEEL